MEKKICVKYLVNFTLDTTQRRLFMFDYCILSSACAAFLPYFYTTLLFMPKKEKKAKTPSVVNSYAIMFLQARCLLRDLGLDLAVLAPCAFCSAARRCAPPPPLHPSEPGDAPL